MLFEVDCSEIDDEEKTTTHLIMIESIWHLNLYNYCVKAQFGWAALHGKMIEMFTMIWVFKLLMQNKLG